MANEPVLDEQGNPVESVNESVSIGKEELEGMKTMIADLQKKSGNNDEIAKLLKESIAAKELPAEPSDEGPTPDELRQMDPDQVIEYLISEVDKNQSEKYGKKIEQLEGQVSALGILREVDYCVNKYENFGDIKNEAREAMKANHSLGVEQAVKLAAAEKGVTLKLRGLPPVKLKKPGEESKQMKMFGEKPGAAPATVQKGGNLSPREAAAAAMADMEAND